MKKQGIFICEIYYLLPISYLNKEFHLIMLRLTLIKSFMDSKGMYLLFVYSTNV